MLEPLNHWSKKQRRGSWLQSSYRRSTANPTRPCPTAGIPRTTCTLDFFGCVGWDLCGRYTFFFFVLGTSKKWCDLDDPRAELCWHDPLRSLKMMFRTGVSFCTTIMFRVGGKLMTPTCIQGVKKPRSEGILKLCFLQLCCGNRYASFGPDCIVACHRWFVLESKVRYLPWGYKDPH